MLLKSLANKIECYSVPEPNTGCWLWIRSADAKGYGNACCHGLIERAHRASYMAFKGPIGEGLCVLHRCDTPSCVNPEHLRLGTNAENVADRVARGREGDRRGRKNGRARLTDEQIRAIRNEPLTIEKAAAKHGCSQITVWRIRAGRIWSEVA